MTLLVHTYTERLVTQHCYRCGVAFGMPEALNNEFLKDHTRQFYCPNGHAQHYLGETEEQRLRKQLEEKERLLQVRQTQLNDSRQAVESLERSKRSLRGHIKRVKAKVGAGVCPVDGCKRHFTNLQRHITTKHPSWKAEEVTV